MVSSQSDTMKEDCGCLMFFEAAFRHLLCRLLTVLDKSMYRSLLYFNSQCKNVYSMCRCIICFVFLYFESVGSSPNGYLTTLPSMGPEFESSAFMTYKFPLYFDLKQR